MGMNKGKLKRYAKLVQVSLVDIGIRQIVDPGRNLYLLNEELFLDPYEYALCFPVQLDNSISQGIEKKIYSKASPDSAIENEVACSEPEGYLVQEQKPYNFPSFSLKDTLESLK